MTALTIWARFIYGPLLDDRERRIAEGTTPGEYGRKEAFSVHRILREKGPVTVPREFVFMDRAAIGLGGVFLHLDARQNWYRLFNELIEDFDLAAVSERQRTPSPPPASRCRTAASSERACVTDVASRSELQREPQTDGTRD